MKSMREMISLMEGVMAVPGLGQGSAGGAGGAEADMQTIGTSGRDQAYSSFDASQGQATESMTYEEAPPGMEDMVMKLKREYPDDHSKAFATAWSIYNKKHGKTDEATSGALVGGALGAALTKSPSGALAGADIGSEMQDTFNESVPAVDSCQQGNPADADVACAMEGTEERSDVVAQALSDFQNMVMNMFVEPESAYDKIVAQLNDENVVAEFNAALEQEGMMSYDNDDDDMGVIDDYSDDAAALASAGHGSDEDYGYNGMEFDEAFDTPVEEAFDLQNGYDDINDASGSDYFPNGADGPVVRATGPSGARQGDNPEQKKMQVAEVHKELVYGYRNFLKESAKTDQKKVK